MTNNLYTGEEYSFRLGVYLTNSRAIQEFNAKSSTFQVGINDFTAMTPAEYRSLLGHRQMNNIITRKAEVKGNAPESVDWRDSGIVNPVKNQAQCGSCWAFSVIQAQESKWAKEKGQLISLSEQNLVDCVTSCYGCNGGDEYISFDYVIKHQGGLFMKEEDYPYTGRDGKCKFDKTKGVCPVKAWMRPTQGNEDELAEGCATMGVVSIAIDAGQWSFQAYSHGIYDEPRCSSTRLDHAVGLVGYGVDNGVKFWLVRNSWGANWGEKGYIRMIRGKKNQCGVATDCVMPVL